jgi:hypothetical protein
MTFAYHTHDLEPYFGSTSSPIDFSGRTEYTFMYPVLVPPRINTDLASQRLGTLLHKMIHAFLEERVCQRYRPRSSNMHSGTNKGHCRA